MSAKAKRKAERQALQRLLDPRTFQINDEWSFVSIVAQSFTGIATDARKTVVATWAYDKHNRVLVFDDFVVIEIQGSWGFRVVVRDRYVEFQSYNFSTRVYNHHKRELA
jgi:hypothetical protein